jgi:hypothetical protein
MVAALAVSFIAVLPIVVHGAGAAVAATGTSIAPASKNIRRPIMALSP